MKLKLLIPAALFLIYLSVLGVAQAPSPTPIRRFPIYANDTAAGTCNTARKGYQYFRSSDNTQRICNGTSWGAAGGGSSLPDITDSAGTLVTVGVQEKVTSGSTAAPGIQVGTTAGNGIFGDDNRLTAVVGNQGTTELRVGITGSGSGGVGIYNGGNQVVDFLNPGAPIGIVQASNRGLSWSNATTNISTADSGLNRVAAKVVSVTDGTTSAAGWLQDAGVKRVSANATNATATMSSGVLSDLTFNVQAGRKYTGTLVVWAKNSTAAEGLQFDFNGGATTTITSVEFGFAATPPGSGLVLGTLNSTAIGTAITATTATTADAVYTIQFTVVINVGGTLIPRFAEVSHTSGTATVELGSYMTLRDTP